MFTVRNFLMCLIQSYIQWDRKVTKILFKHCKPAYYLIQLEKKIDRTLEKQIGSITRKISVLIVNLIYKTNSTVIEGDAPPEYIEFFYKVCKELNVIPYSICFLLFVDECQKRKVYGTYRFWRHHITIYMTGDVERDYKTIAHEVRHMHQRLYLPKHYKNSLVIKLYPNNRELQYRYSWKELDAKSFAAWYLRRDKTNEPFIKVPSDRFLLKNSGNLHYLLKERYYETMEFIHQ